MKAKKVFPLAMAALLSVVALTGCDNRKGGGDNPGGDVTDVDAHAISIVNNVAGVTLTSNVTSAKKGELVKITVEVTDTSIAVTKVLYNNKECAKLNDTTYTFEMPGEAVQITFETDLDLDRYGVVINASSDAITLAADKTKAKKGELITLTATYHQEGATLTQVLYNGKEATKVNDNTYTFTMPDETVFVTYQVSITGDVVLKGDIAAAFVKQTDDIYVAKNVTVNQEAYFDVEVKEKNGVVKKDITDVNRFKTFANITSGAGSKYALKIVGGATYDFTYDKSNAAKPLSVVRTKVNVLPETATGISNLLNSDVFGHSSLFAKDMSGMTYENNLAKQKITWKAYQDQTTYGLVETKENDVYKESGAYYTKLDGDKLVVVDTFVPGLNSAYKFNDKLSRDRIKYSGEYKVADFDENGKAVDANEFKYDSDFVNANVAHSLVTQAPIDFSTFEEDIKYGYRLQHNEKGSEVTQTSTVITASEIEGGFKVNLVSSNTFESTAQDYLRNHYEYRGELTFRNDGALLSGAYKEKLFTEKEYDFIKDAFKVGDADSNFDNDQMGTVKVDVNIAYTYGDLTANDSQFDPAPYLVSTISSASIVNNSVADNVANKLEKGDKVNEYLTVSAQPTTALNAGQYDVIASSDQAIVAPINGSFYAKGVGEADLTVGIPNGFGATKTVHVQVFESRLVKNYYMNSRYSKYQEAWGERSNVYTGQVNEYGIDCKFKDNKSTGIQGLVIPTDTTARVIGKNPGFEVSINHEKQTIIVDASNVQYVKPDQQVRVEILTEHYDPDWNSYIDKDTGEEKMHHSIFIYTIYEGAKSDKLAGRWHTSYENEYIEFTMNKGVNTKYPYLGHIHATDNDFKPVEIDFTYNFNPMTQRVDVDLIGDEYRLSTFTVEYDVKNDTMNVVLVLQGYAEDGSEFNNPIFGFTGGPGSEDTPMLFERTK